MDIYLAYFKQFWETFKEDFIDFSLLSALVETPLEGLKKIFPKRYQS